MKASGLTVASRPLSIRSIVAMLALIFIVAACQPVNPMATSSATSPSPAGSPVASPSTAPPLSSNWVHATIPTGLGAPLIRVVWTGTEFMAVDGVDGTLLSSIDGRTWKQQPRLADGYIGQVAVGAQGLLAVGSVNEEGVVAIWRSTDGLNWAATPDAPSLHGRDGAFLTMAAVAVAGSGWLAVGGEHVNCVPGACGLVRAVAWTSPDGVLWTRSTDSAAMQHAEMTGVVDTPTGYLAVGDVAADPARPDAAIRPATWTSPDGRTWTRSNLLPVVEAAAATDVRLDSVTVSANRVVAVGHMDTPADALSDAFAWWTDGSVWSSVEIGRFVLSQGVRVVAVPGGLLAMFGTGDGACLSAIWDSADGSSWTCIGNDPAFVDSAVSDAAVGPDAEVLVGSGPDEAMVLVSAPH